MPLGLGFHDRLKHKERVDSGVIRRVGMGNAHSGFAKAETSLMGWRNERLYRTVGSICNCALPPDA